MESARPMLLSVLCLAGFIGCFLNGLIVLSPPAQNASPWYPTYLSLSTVYCTLCLTGLWMMRRWAVMAYSSYMLANQAVYLVLGKWNWFALVLSGATTFVGWFYYRKMKGFERARSHGGSL